MFETSGVYTGAWCAGVMHDGRESCVSSDLFLRCIVMVQNPASSKVSDGAKLVICGPWRQSLVDVVRNTEAC